MKPTVSAVIFDLDGTLIASLEDLADAVNAALTAYSLPVHPVAAYNYFVGDGMAVLVRRAVPEGTSDATAAAVLERVKEEYARNWAYKTRAYNGIDPMLEKLAAMDVPLAVLSNKPHRFTVEVVEHFFPGTPFRVVQGHPDTGPGKPDPALALAIAERLALEPARIGFMGDSRTDMDTAVNAGMLPIGVLWGFRPESELTRHGARVLLARPEALFTEVAFVS